LYKFRKKGLFLGGGHCDFVGGGGHFLYVKKGPALGGVIYTENLDNIYIYLPESLHNHCMTHILGGDYRMMLSYVINNNVQWQKRQTTITTTTTTTLRLQNERIVQYKRFKTILISYIK
jgi:hypothetical protein